MNIQGPIGLFDSSLGGLTVYKEIRKLLPQENYIYFGDTGRSPYGSRPKSELELFTRQMIEFMKKRNAKAIVVACNTVTSLGLEQFSQEYGLPIIGVSRVPELTVHATTNKLVGIIATEFTVRSGLHRKEICAIDPSIQVFYQACPRFTPILNSGDLDGAEARNAVEEYLTPLKANRIDTLVLACTAFPFLLKPIRHFIGKEVTIIDPAADTAMFLSNTLRRSRQLHRHENSSNDLYFSDPDIEKLSHIAGKIMDISDCRFLYLDMESTGKGS